MAVMVMMIMLTAITVLENLAGNTFSIVARDNE
jgi:hypothetical protein